MTTVWRRATRVIVTDRSRASKLLSSTNTRDDIAGVVSICNWKGADYTNGDRRPHGLRQARSKLLLTFDDQELEGGSGPTLKDAEQLCQYLGRFRDCFLNQRPDSKRLLIHCYAGKRRSAAVALVGYAMVLGPCLDAVEHTRASCEIPGPDPNQLLVSLCDKVLGLDGELRRLLRSFG